ncbi:MAG: hypothetical protein JSR00_08465 [Bacteroidetes bacterium]|nr:hypothetical protein [Bacteroidota bacterium]
MKNFLFALLMLAGFSAQAQISEPVKWTYSAKKVSDKVYDIYITAILDKTWHLYSQDAGEGPEPTSFTFVNNPIVKLDGDVKEVGTLEKAFDPNFNSVLKFYSNKVDFVQRVKLKTSANTIFKGSVTFMVCNDKKCLPPRQVPFTVNLSGK